MNSVKPVYLMAGGRGGKASDSLMKGIFKEINKEKPIIAYVGAASNDDKMFFRFISLMIKRGGNCDLKQVMLCSKKADIQKAKETLEGSDAVFMSGGDVEAGMQVLEEKGLTGFMVELYKKGKLFFGASAGSIMLANKWVRWSNPDDDDTAELFHCLGIAPVICDTHAEEDDWEELQWAVRLEKEGLTGYGIPTNGCLKIDQDGNLHPLDKPIARYQKHNQAIEKLEDFRPEQK